MSSAGMFTLFLCILLPLVHATIFVTAPWSSTTCHGGQDCLVQWVDNGEAPVLSTIGPCFVGLYNGNGILVQQIEPVDVSAIHSLQFMPDPSAGPNSHDYYVNFTSVNAVGNSSSHYIQYSPFFALTGMSGSLQSPVPSDTSSPAVPSTVASASPTSITTTISIPNTFTSSGVASSASASPSSSAASGSSSLTASSTSGPAASSSTSSAQSTTVSGPSTSSGSSSVASPASSVSTAPSNSVPAGSSTLTVPASMTTSRLPLSTPSPTSTSAASGSSAATSATSGAVQSISFGSASFTMLALLSPAIAFVSGLL